MEDPKLGRKRRRRCICLWITATLLGLGLLFLILGLTVFKAKRPVIAVDSVSISDLDVIIDATLLRVLVNLTLDVDATVTNPNRVGFKYSDSTCFLQYRGNDVGEVPLPAGKIGDRETRGFNLTLSLMADRLLSDADFFSDVTSGTLAFQTRIRISGRVHVLFVIHVVAYSSCDIEIDVVNRSITKQKCHYKTKL